MCGIVGSIGADIKPGIHALVHRGPDAQGMVRIGDVRLGHTRLAILDLEPP
jgi:asparagine synthetase B (glutamine-hydrolysing)